jgi:hypothetical protein
LKFEKRSQFFVGGDDESLSVVAVCISNEDRLSVGINRCDAAPTPTGFAEIVSDDFPELHVDRIVPLLVSTQQSQNDMKGGAMTRASVLTEQTRAWRGLCRIIRHLGSGISRKGSKHTLRLFELARVLVRFDHVASVIVNANDCVM